LLFDIPSEPNLTGNTLPPELEDVPPAAVPGIAGLAKADIVPDLSLPQHSVPRSPSVIASGEKAKARDILAAMAHIEERLCVLIGDAEKVELICDDLTPVIRSIVLIAVSTGRMTIPLSTQN
jgi:hypothetical protein